MTAPPSRVVRLEAMLVLGRLAARNRACQQDAVREGVVPVLMEMMMDGELTTPGAVCCLFRHWVGVVLCTFCNVPPTVQGRREMGGAFQSQQQTVVFALLCAPRVHLPHTLRVCPLIMCHSGNCRLSVFKVYCFLDMPIGAHPPLAGPTQLSRVTPTAGGRRLSLTDEGRLTHLISGAQHLDQTRMGLEPIHPALFACLLRF